MNNEIKPVGYIYPETLRAFKERVTSFGWPLQSSISTHKFVTEGCTVALYDRDALKEAQLAAIRAALTMASKQTGLCQAHATSIASIDPQEILNLTKED